MKALLEKIDGKTAAIGIVGMGYVGLPLAIAFAECGFRVRGFDTDLEKLSKLRRGVQYLSHVEAGEFFPFVERGQLDFATTYSDLAFCDVFIVCVPTPLTENREPDLSFIEQAATGLKVCVLPSKLFVLESSTYPGTTRDVFARILSKDMRMEAGRDIFIAHSPERQDPGNQRFKTRNVPKVVGGLTRNCLCVASRLYRKVIETVVEVEDAETAEMVKLFENTYRMVNIAVVNELKVLCHRLDLDVWSVVKAAATKPFGFQSFKPGPGLGGHCFVPGTPVITSEGPVPIEEVKAGDFVLTEGGGLSRVLEAMWRDYDGEVATVKVRGMPPATMTLDHGVYAATDGRPAKNGRAHHPVDGTSTAELLGELRKVPAGELAEKSHYVAWPISEGKPTLCPPHVTREYLELAGWYLSEGNLVTAHDEEGGTKSIRVQASICAGNVDDVATVKDLLPRVVAQFNAELPPNHRRERSEVRVQDRGTCIVIRQGCIPLGESLLTDFGQHAADKKIPPWLLWSNDLEWVCLLLRGMFRGDGHSCRDTGGFVYATASEALAYGVVVLLGRLMIRCNLELTRHEEKLDAYRVKVRNGPDALRLSELIDFPLRAEPGKGSEQIVYRGDGNWYRRVELVVRSEYRGKVYNLHVEGINKYVTPIGLVANCIPIDPFYLTWKARQVGMNTRFIELAGEINSGMPYYVVGRLTHALNEHSKPVKGSSVLVLGVAYKANVNDVRESPAIKVVQILQGLGAIVEYHDPRIPMLEVRDQKTLESVPLTTDRLRTADAVLVLTDHEGVDYIKVGELAKLIVDSRNVEALRSLNRGRYYSA
jgi:UDP-N-acetyl-D-mannosaminuronate dehydrogenase